jgi:NADH dehydrogenase (ubiquinone) 1 beta subcomplex subunit 10
VPCGECQHREYPRVPGLAEVDRSDPAALIEARHQEARDKWVAIMGTRLLREQLRECYMREGVNHLKNCRELAQEYVHRVKDASTSYQTWDKQVRRAGTCHAHCYGR